MAVYISKTEQKEYTRYRRTIMGKCTSYREFVGYWIQMLGGWGFVVYFTRG